MASHTVRKFFPFPIPINLSDDIKKKVSIWNQHTLTPLLTFDSLVFDRGREQVQRSGQALFLLNLLSQLHSHNGKR